MPSMRNVVVVDAGPLLACFDRDDAHHAQAVAYLGQSRVRLLSTLAVVTEAMHLFRTSLPPKLNLLSWINTGALTLISPEAADFERVAQLLAKYADLPMDFADALTVAVCERLDIPHIATFDSDFEIYRFKGRRRFINVLR
jgi:uncharacterized protein